jgi:5-methylcytosine-specific restriction endonuclease McrA
MKTEEQKIKQRIRQKRYAEKHKKKCLAASRKWNSENKDKMLKAAKRFYEKNKDNPEFKEENRKKAIDWARRNPDKVLEQSARKRATKLKRVPKWLTKDDKWIMQEIYRLAKDRTKLTGIEWNVDHIIPLRGKNVSGLHVPSNLMVIEKTQNLTKSNKFKEY